jgi:flagella synthesis protein FlgN
MASPITTLRDEQQLITALVDLMQREQQLLISADSDGLATTTAQKSTLVLQMGTLANLRHQALGAAGFAASEAGMDAWLAGANDGAARTLWLETLERTRAAKELNRVNGMLINKQMSNTQVVLNAMRTPAAGAEAGFYGPSGQTTVSGPSRRFVVG